MTDRDTEPKSDRPTIDLEAERSETLTSAPDVAPEDETTAGDETEAAGEAPGTDRGPDPEIDHEPGAAPKAAVTPEPPATPEPPSIPPPRQPGFVSLLVAGFLGALVAVAILYAVQASGVLPVASDGDAEETLRRTAAMEASIAADAEAVGALRDDLTALRTELDTRIGELTAADAAQGDPIAALREDLAEVRALAESAASTGGVTPGDLAAAIGQLDSRLTAGLAAAGDASAVEAARATADQTRAALDDTRNAVDGIDARVTDLLADLDGRLAALATRIDALEAASKAKPPPMSATGAMAVLLLENAAAGSDPFPGVVDAVADVLPESEDLAQLRALAAEGAPTRAELRGRFPTVEEAMHAAATAALATDDTTEAAADETAGTGEQLGLMLQGMFSGVVSVRPIEDPAAGEETAGIASVAAAVEAGDLQAAVQAGETLSPAVRPAAEAWLADAQRRLALETLVAGVAEMANVAGNDE